MSAQVNLKNLVVFASSIRTERRILVLCSFLSNWRSLGGSQIVGHPLVEWENTCCCSQLGSHVADGSHASAADALNSFSKVLNDAHCTSLNCQDTSKFQDNILW